MNAKSPFFDPVILAGYSAQGWAKKLAQDLAVKTGNTELGQFHYRIFANDETSPVLIGVKKFPPADGEPNGKNGVNLRNADVIIVPGAAGSPNNNIIEAQMMTNIALNGFARSITTVVTSLPYGRQDSNFEQRAPVGLGVALDNLFGKSQFAIIVDPHNADVTASLMQKYPANYQPMHYAPIFAQQIGQLFADGHLKRENSIIVGLDKGGADRMRQDFLTAFRQIAGMELPNRGKDMPYLDKDRDRITGKPTFSGIKNAAPDALRGKDVIVPEDIIDTAGSAIGGAAYMKRVLGARSVTVLGSNGIFSAKRTETVVQDPHDPTLTFKLSVKNRNPAAAVLAIDRSAKRGFGIDAVFVSDSYDHARTDPKVAAAIEASPIIHQVGVTPLVSSIVAAIHNPDRNENSVSQRLSGGIQDMPAEPTPLKPHSPLRRLGRS